MNEVRTQLNFRDQHTPRISFGIIVLNGEPFTRYCLRALYRFAHEIIVVEGGHEDARSVCTPNGHSIDGTLETLYRFKNEEDPENKLQIVTRDGFWPKKDEFGKCRTIQSRAYAERATGDYLWQVDIDEFYRPEHIEKVVCLLCEQRHISSISFKQLTFWGGLQYVVDSWALRRGEDEYHRLFKWGPGYKYVMHEPPTVVDNSGNDLRTLNWIRGSDTMDLGILLYHYSLLFPWQVRQKVLIYRDEKPEMCSEIVRWAETNYFRINHPYRVHNLYRVPSWFERFNGEHPPAINEMMRDIRSGKLDVELRPNQDVEELLGQWWYPIGRASLKAIDPVHLAAMNTLRIVRRGLRRVVSPMRSRSM
jgi:hypothetical protein